jgi:hypothetical protein
MKIFLNPCHLLLLLPALQLIDDKFRPAPPLRLSFCPYFRYREYGPARQ